MFSILALKIGSEGDKILRKKLSRLTPRQFFSRNFVTLVANFEPKLKTWSRQSMFYTKKFSFKPQHWPGEWFLQEGVSRVASLWFIEGNWCSPTFGNEIKKRLWGRIIAVCLLGNKLDVFLLQKSCHRSTPIGCACVFVFLMVMMLSSDRIPNSIDIRFE